MPGARATTSRASDIVFTPTGGLSSTNVQSALAELDAEKAALGSGGAGSNFWALLDEDYGGACDGQMVTDAFMSAGYATLNSASGLFTVADEGKSIVVSGTGVAGADLSATINAVNSPTQITLSVSASGTVSNAHATWGTSDAAKIQTALNELNTAGGGQIYIPHKRVFTGYTDKISMPANVGIVGKGRGPYDIGGTTHPGKETIAPTIFITNPTDSFITCVGRNTSLEHLCFFYPLQVNGNSSTPKAYPWMVTAFTGLNFRYNFIPNVYKGIYSYTSGRVRIVDNKWGVINFGIWLERCGDVTWVHHNLMECFWHIWSGTNLGSPLDVYTINNATGLRLGWAEQFSILDLFCFWIYTGIHLEENLTFSPAGMGSYGTMVNVAFDISKRGIYVKGGNDNTGWTVHGLHMAGYDSSSAAIVTDSGYRAPKIRVTGGNLWNNFVSGKVVRNAGSVKLTDVRGYNPVGNFTAPSVPATDVAYTNNYPHACRVNVYGGTVTAIKIGGVATGLTNGSFVLDVDETITLTYSSVPSWTWFGL